MIHDHSLLDSDVTVCLLTSKVQYTKEKYLSAYNVVTKTYPNAKMHDQ